MRLHYRDTVRGQGIPQVDDWGGRILPLHGCAGGVVGYINSSQDGAICHRDAIVPCLTSGHGNCPKVIEYDDGKQEIG